MQGDHKITITIYGKLMQILKGKQVAYYRKWHVTQPLGLAFLQVRDLSSNQDTEFREEEIVKILCKCLQKKMSQFHAQLFPPKLKKAFLWMERVWGKTYIWFTVSVTSVNTSSKTRFVLGKASSDLCNVLLFIIIQLQIFVRNEPYLALIG